MATEMTGRVSGLRGLAPLAVTLSGVAFLSVAFVLAPVALQVDRRVGAALTRRGTLDGNAALGAAARARVKT